MRNLIRSMSAAPQPKQQPKRGFKTLRTFLLLLLGCIVIPLLVSRPAAAQSGGSICSPAPNPPPNPPFYYQTACLVWNGSGQAYGIFSASAAGPANPPPQIQASVQVYANGQLVASATAGPSAGGAGASASIPNPISGQTYNVVGSFLCSGSCPSWPSAGGNYVQGQIP